MASMASIGIYGGTFDPVHYGHLRTALEVKEVFGLNEIRLIPCSQPAHRGDPVLTAEMRLKMLKLAVQNQTGLVVDRRELDREGFSYMVDTLKSFREENPVCSLLLFIGTDAFQGLTSWYKWQSLFEYAHVIVITRPGYEQNISSDILATKLVDNINEIKTKKSGHLFFQKVTQLDISATAIRKIIGSGLNPTFLLPDNVIDYIKQNKLYL